MKTIKTPQDIKKLGTILSVWAHPDDESFLAAGIMAVAARQGQKVICITATRGENGSYDESRWPANAIGKIRAKEMNTALNILGVEHHHWLNYEDGKCADADQTEASRKIFKLIDSYKPNSILTFGSDGLTGHPDHQAVSRWCTEACKNKGIEAKIYHAVIEKKQYQSYLKEADKKVNIFFNIKKPPIVDEDDCSISFTLPIRVLTLKRRALEAMPSQTKELFSKFGDTFLDNAFRTEFFINPK